MTLKLTFGAAALSLLPGLVLADPVTVTDIAGREVTLPEPADRVILGEGRQIFFAAVLDGDDPFKRVVGWREDLLQAAPESYAIYAEKFPHMADIPTFGGFKDGTFDIEQAVALDPDVMIMNLEAKAATDEAGYEEKLAKVGIPIVYVDFREKPFENTAQSMQIIGQLFGETARALNSTPSTRGRSRGLRMCWMRKKGLSGHWSLSNARAAIQRIAACPSAMAISAPSSNWRGRQHGRAVYPRHIRHGQRRAGDRQRSRPDRGDGRRLGRLCPRRRLDRRRSRH